MIGQLCPIGPINRRGYDQLCPNGHECASRIPLRGILDLVKPS